MENSKKHVLISDDGVVKTNKHIHINVFVTLCRVVSLILAIVGVLAFIEGNF